MDPEVLVRADVLALFSTADAAWLLRGDASCEIPGAKPLFLCVQASKDHRRSDWGLVMPSLRSSAAVALCLAGEGRSGRPCGVFCIVDLWKLGGKGGRVCELSVSRRGRSYCMWYWFWG